MKKITFLTLLSFAFFLLSTSIVAQRTGEQIDKSGIEPAAIVVNPLNGTTVTPNDLVEEIIGSGITYSNVSYTGGNPASGLFSSGFTGGIGLDDGVILSSGLAINVIGPNASSGISSSNGLPGDSDLNALIPQTTYDASVLEFDFVPTDATLEIHFVFGSDEYNEYVNSNFNDVFAFFLDGVNIALIPSTSIPVSINNINNGNAGGGSLGTGPCTNCVYYIDNATGANNTEMDGYTTLIVGTGTVTPGNTHHIKLAIADAGDSALDSWVLIKSDSFGAPIPNGIPLSNWAIVFGIFLIAVFVAIHFRRRLA